MKWLVKNYGTGEDVLWYSEEYVLKLKQKIEDLEEKLHFKHLYKLSGKCFFDEANICHYFDDFVKTRKALEEIRETILNYESKEWNCFNDMDAKLEKISKILDTTRVYKTS